MPRLEMGNCAFGLEFVTARKAGYNFGYIVFYVIKHSVARHDALCCKKKYSNSRQSTSAICANIVTADRVCDATGWNTLTADRVPDAIRWNTLTGDRVCATTAKILSRPTEYLMRFCVYCSAVFLNSILFRKIKKKNYKK